MAAILLALRLLIALLQRSIRSASGKPAVLGIALLLFALTGASAADEKPWSMTELLAIKTLSLSNLPRMPRDPSNAFADDPKAAALGKAFFFDTSFSANGAVSCSSCHVPDRQFQDGLPVGHGMSDGNRRTMPLAGTAFHPFFFWDGRKDSLWSQALGPLENPLEHGADRMMAAKLIASNYRTEYEELFGPIADLADFPAHAAPAGTLEVVAAWSALTADQQHTVNLAFANMGKAIEAFERTIPVPRTRFDDFADAVSANDLVLANRVFTQAERNGLKLFLSQGCLACHIGPQFTDRQFHNIALPNTSAETDIGRSTSTHVLKDDPFNCLGEFSDAKLPYQCQPTRTMEFDKPEQLGSFTSPSLRGVAQRPPYMHNGQFASLHDVLVHYNKAPPAIFGKTGLSGPRNMDAQQLADLEAFLIALNVDDNAAR